MKYYLLKHKAKINGILSPGLNGKYVIGKDDFFDNGKSSSTKFYDQDYKFDYLVPVEFGEVKEKPQIIVDLHMWIGLDIPFGGRFHPISKNFKELLENYKLQAHKFYDATVLFHDNYYPYYVWQVLSKKYQEYIDFDKTYYNNLNSYRKLKHEELEVKQFSSYDEMRKYSRSNWNRNWNYEKIVMKPSFRDIDYCYVYGLNGGDLISEKLKIAIEDAELTGIEFEKSPIPIEFSDEVE